MTSVRRLPRVLIGCVVVAACSAPAPGSPPHRDRPPVEAPQDRDEHAVVDALRRLDMCALLGTVVPAGSTFSAPSPSHCSGSTITVAVSKLGSDERLRLASRTIGGAKAYLSGTQGCTVSLPVSFELVVQFLGPDPCDGMAERLAPAAAALANPTAIEVEPRWEACAALRTVPDTAAAGVDNLDGCVDTKSFAELDLKYGAAGSFPVGDWRKETIDGVDVWTLDDRNPDAPSCTTQWTFSSRAENQLIAQVRAADCGRVEPLVKPLVATLRTKPGPGHPQRPLLYGPDDPDTPFPGACAYLNLPNRAGCAPYTETSLPAQGELTSTTDPNVECAVAADAVTKAFGAELAPVTSGEACYFVSPERLVQIRFELWREPLKGSAKGRPVTIAGHPGFRGPVREADPVHTVYLSATTAADEPGVLVLDLAPGPLGGGRLPDSTADQVDAVLMDIVRRHFS